MSLNLSGPNKIKTKARVSLLDTPVCLPDVDTDFIDIVAGDTLASFLFNNLPRLCITNVNRSN